MIMQARSAIRKNPARFEGKVVVVSEPCPESVRRARSYSPVWLSIVVCEDLRAQQATVGGACNIQAGRQPSGRISLAVARACRSGWIPHHPSACLGGRLRVKKTRTRTDVPVLRGIA